MSKASIYSIAVSPERGQLKKEICEAEIITDFGIKNDGHAGAWGRQITCLNRQSVIDATNKYDLKMSPGDFAENMQIENMDFSHLSVGSKIKLGDEVIIEITQIGKEDHPSIVTETFGISLLPSEGLFCRVLRGGIIKKGDSAEIIA